MRRYLPTAAILAITALIGTVSWFVSGAFAASTSSGTFAMKAGTNLNVTCPNALTNTNVAADSETVNCAAPTTTTTVASTTTSTVASTTTVAPTTTTTAGGGGGSGSCTSNPQGNLGPFDYSGITNSNGHNTYVSNNMWGANGTGATQTVCAVSPGNWTMTANAPNDPGGAVLTYPDVQQLMDDWNGSGWNNCVTCADTPLSALHSLSSTYAITDPPDNTGDWEAAYDIWLNNTPNSEIMLWVDTSDARGTGGSTVVNSNVSSGGNSWTYMNYGGGLPILKLNTNATSGTIDILAALQYLQSIGQVSTTATIGQLDFGWEVCSTVGTQNFAMTGYTLSMS